MPLLCPNCREPLAAGSFECPNQHRFPRQNGVLALLSDPFRTKLDAFLEGVQQFRQDQNLRILDAALYEQLPFVDVGWAQWEWQYRRYDVANITRLLRNRSAQSILDIGAWNGWLSHQLSLQGHQVTAIDYFIDTYDGLGAKQFYSTDWCAIQMDLADLSLLDQQFEVVIVNHGLHFQPDPLAYVTNAQAKVAPGGLLILLGLQFYQDTQMRKQRLAELTQDFEARYQSSLFLRPTKGYLDFADKDRLAAQGIALKPYPQLWRANLKSLLLKSEAQHYYGVATQS